MKKLLLILVSAAWFLNPGLVLPLHAAAPLRVSDDGRALVYPDGTPFFPMVDTAWDVFISLSREQMLTYLDTRAVQDFNIVMGVVLSALQSPQRTNYYGEAAFLSNNVDTPNPAFFEHVDHFVDEASARGLMTALLPVWGRDVVDTGFVNTNNAEGYGQFIGARYGHKPVIFVLGGDRIGTNRLDVWRLLARGIAKGVSGGIEDHSQVLITYHSANNSGYYHDEPWLDFNSIQSGAGAAIVPGYSLITPLYQRVPTKPVIDLEANYEDHTIGFVLENGRYTDIEPRRQGYWTVLAGACGYTYGATGVYQFHRPGEPPKVDPQFYWYDAIHFTAANDMRHLRALFESRPDRNRAPAPTLLVSNNWTGADVVIAGRDTNGTHAIVFSPTGKPFTVQMNRINGPDVDAWWYNPRDGTATKFGPFPNVDLRVFSPPDTNDWLLVLDDAAENFLPPGQRIPMRMPDIRAEGDNLILFWETGDGSTRLEATTNFRTLGAPPLWAPAGGITNFVDDKTEVTKPSSDPEKYFRLRRP